MGKEIPTRSEDYSLWYNELVKKADLAEHSDVRGCMVIKPYGYSIWEKMQAALDKMYAAVSYVRDQTVAGNVVRVRRCCECHRR
jgi:prolyl-tRNA synthetase